MSKFEIDWDRFTRNARILSESEEQLEQFVGRAAIRFYAQKDDSDDPIPIWAKWVSTYNPPMEAGHA